MLHTGKMNHMGIPENLIMVIFGASGDLTIRKLLPALFELYCRDMLPEGFGILGTGRTQLDDHSFREKAMEGPLREKTDVPECRGKMDTFLQHLYYLSIDPLDETEYVLLRERLLDLDFRYNVSGNYIFYLATPPELYHVIPGNLASQRLNQSPGNSAERKIVIEKPFGMDLASARELNAYLRQFFDEKQIYRIDHYLGKETVQNLLVTRFSNGIFEPLWNRNFIDKVEVTAAENLGVENRGRYYDKAGALRDMVQNHLLQLTGIIAMEPPSSMDAEAIRSEIAKVFNSIKRYTEEEIEKNVIRGQYVSSFIRGNPVKGYREEPHVDPNSRTETFVALKMYIDNWRWAGVPFYIRTGKRMPTRVTEAVIYFRSAPLALFTGEEENMVLRHNQLILRIQPDEGILVRFGMKVPGAGFRVKEVNMDFHYRDLADIRLPDAYERLLYDCMMGDPTLYTRGDTLEAAWKFIDPILAFWNDNRDAKLYGYPAGTWGPEEVNSLFNSPGESWRYPCRNLSDSDNYCEL
jgi:glucose-6-phosphate 1-dehydrogenase